MLFTRCSTWLTYVVWVSTLDFIKGVDKLHAFYTENVRMLARAYDLTDEEAARALENYDFRNVARAILRPPRVDLVGQSGLFGGSWSESDGTPS